MAILNDIYDVNTVRKVMAFNTFLINVNSCWEMAENFSQDFLTDAAMLGKAFQKLSARHCLSKRIVPYNINNVLMFFGFKPIAILLSRPINLTAFFQSATSLIEKFCEKHGNIFNTKIFWPENCPANEWGLFMGNQWAADGLYDALMNEIKEDVPFMRFRISV